MFRAFILPVITLLTTGTAVHANSLREVYEQAARNNAAYQAAGASYQAGQEQRRIDRAGLLPQVTVNAEYLDSRTRSSGDLPVGSTNDDDKSISTAYGANLTQALFDLSAWNRYQQGKALTEASTAQYSVAQQQLVLSAAQVYFDVLRTADNLETSLAEEAALTQQLSQTRDRYDVGLVAMTDVMEAQARYDLVVAERLGFQGQLGIAFAALGNLTGQRWHAIAPLQGGYPVRPTDPAEVNDWIELATTNSPQLAAAEQTSKAAHSQAKAVRGRLFPSLQGQLSYRDTDWDRDTYGDATDTRDHTTTVLLSLEMPLYLGGGLHAQRRQSAYLAARADAERLGVQRDLVQQVTSLHRLVNTGVARVKAGEQSVLSAQTALKATTEGFQAGTRNTLDVLTALRNLYSARRDTANYRYDYILDLLSLKRASGVLTPVDIDTLDALLETERSITRDGKPAAR